MSKPLNPAAWAAMIRSMPEMSLRWSAFISADRRSRGGKLSLLANVWVPPGLIANQRAGRRLPASPK